MKIKIDHDSTHVVGYNGAFYRFTNPDGGPSAYGIFDGWYTAIGEDDEGHTYRIVWHIDNMAAFNRGDEDCCDWLHPDEIICDDTGLPVADYAIIC